jgi:hypothetical protein
MIHGLANKETRIQVASEENFTNAPGSRRPLGEAEGFARSCVEQPLGLGYGRRWPGHVRSQKLQEGLSTHLRHPANVRPRGCPSPSDHPMIRRQAADGLSMET